MTEQTTTQYTGTVDRVLPCHYLRCWKVLTSPCDHIISNDRTDDHPIRQRSQHDVRHLPVLLINKGEGCAAHADGCNNVGPGSHTHGGVLHHKLLGGDEVYCHGDCVGQ